MSLDHIASTRVNVCSRATGETISLTPKATDILIILVTNAGELIEKDELMKRSLARYVCRGG